MNPNKLHKPLALLLSTALILLALPLAAGAAPIPTTGNGAAPAAAAAVLPPYDRFVSVLSNGQAGVVRGVYVPGVLAMRVAQQPAGNPLFVSAVANVATQFSIASPGVTGLVAHNYSSGGLFFNLATGQEVRVVYGDGTVKRYLVTSISQYQALDPNSPYSNFLELNTGATLTSTDVFNKFYTGGQHVTFQTCIAQDGNLTWGRLFVVATPLY